MEASETTVDAPFVYRFVGAAADGDASMRALLGGKGANLAEMARIGIPVPPGFTIATTACVHAMRHGGALPEDLEAQTEAAIEAIEAETGARLGGPQPLLLSVRSGARASMPGMMDTVLDVGVCDANLEALAARGGERFALDCQRRFVQMYANVVLGVDGAVLEAVLTEARREHGAASDADLGAADWRGVIGRLRDAVREHCGMSVPDDPREQLWGAVRAVLASWNTPRAVAYRRIHRIPNDWGTAVNVMAMVYGNLGADSATGVAFTRNPATGEPSLYGEYLVNAQGEDVVAGIRTPAPLSTPDGTAADGQPSLEERMPEIYHRLDGHLRTLERHFRDMQDVEFTVEQGTLWILQTRSGKRTGRAAVRVAFDLLAEGIVRGDRDLLARIEPGAHVAQLLHRTLDTRADFPPPLVTGLAASPGAADGRVVFDADEAERRGAAGEPVVLVREETSADDIHGMHAARGILTARGGLTSHAAVVARGMGVPCVAGAEGLSIDADAGYLEANGARVAVGEWLTVDGTGGAVYAGRQPTVEPDISGDFGRLMEVADRHRRLGVLANADTPEDAARARSLGAEGIGLVRTEHMFFATDERLESMRAMILATTDTARDAALEALLPFQRADFEGLLRAMDGLPVTVRLLDPPLHEFLPGEAADVDALAKRLGQSPRALHARIEQLHENNPMLGFRGCRIGIVHEPVYRMQVRAIVEAALSLRAEGLDPHPEIMVPLVALAEELAVVRRCIDDCARGLIEAAGSDLRYKVGTMIELPRAALLAGEIAAHADFFSFGTNDLTQTTFGISRDDAGRFLPAYQALQVLAEDPFVAIDVDGVGELVRIGVERGRAANPGLVIGICGEHGGEPRSVAFCHEAGLDYVSCSPFRVPGARLAAARAACGLGPQDGEA